MTTTESGSKGRSKGVSRDKHHILFEKHFWDQEGYREMRQKPCLIVEMDRSVHNALHRRVVPVPPPGKSLIDRMIKRFNELEKSAERKYGNPIESPVIGIALLVTTIDWIIERDSERSAASGLEVELLVLIKHNLLAQLEIIEESEARLPANTSETQSSPAAGTSKLAYLEGGEQNVG